MASLIELNLILSPVGHNFHLKISYVTPIIFIFRSQTNILMVSMVIILDNLHVDSLSERPDLLWDFVEENPKGI